MRISIQSTIHPADDCLPDSGIDPVVVDDVDYLGNPMHHVDGLKALLLFTWLDFLLWRKKREENCTFKADILGSFSSMLASQAWRVASSP